MKHHKYSAINRKSGMIIFFIILSAAISTFAIWFCYALYLDNALLYTPLTIPFILFFPFMMLQYLGAKILLTDNSVIRKTPISKKSIRYTEIKTFKIVETMASQFGATHLTTSKVKRRNILSICQIFIATKKNSSPNDIRKGKSLLFNYNHDLHKRLKEGITAANKGYK